MVDFGNPLIQPQDQLIRSTLQLHLLGGEGAVFNTIEACRAGSQWSEFQVTWSNQPAGQQPCSSIPVALNPELYEWDLTELVRETADGSPPNFGIKLESENELPINLRSFHSGESPARPLRPQLLVQDVPVLEGVDATFSVTPMPEGDRMTVALVPTAAGLQIGQVEFYFKEQTPNWIDVEIVTSPEGWSAEVGTATCEDQAGATQSDFARFFSPNPAEMGDTLEFELDLVSPPPIPTEIIQMQLVGRVLAEPIGDPRNGEVYLGSVLARRIQPGPEIVFEIETDRSEYAQGDPLTLLVEVRNTTSQTVLIDPYIVLQRPDGALYSYVYPDRFEPIDPLHFVDSLQPVVSDFPLGAGISAADLALFTLSLGAGIPTQPSGFHSFFAALAAAGTLDLLTPIDRADFTVD